MIPSASVEEDEQRSNNSPASSSSLVEERQRPFALPHSASSCALRKTSASVTASCTMCRSLSHQRSEQWVRLNVGGTYFVTTRTTLLSDEGSFFCRLLEDETDLTTDRDDTGAYMIDRDPEYFSAVLNYLRHGKLVLSRHLREEGVLEEAEFYMLNRLKKLTEQRILHMADEAKARKTRHIYRVLQCQEDELPTIVSGMSDGWKFEQLVKGPQNTGGYYSYGSAATDSAFLCIVSKECEETLGEQDKQTDRVNALLTKARQM